MTQNCPICYENRSTEIISFGDQPNSYDFQESKCISVEKHSLALHTCDRCGFVFVLEPFPAVSMYANYRWSTSFHPAPHTDWLISEIGRHLDLASDDLIVDIGCNDGHLLGRFKVAGYTILVGIEPAGDCARIARDSGLSVVEGYYDDDQAKQIADRYGKARVIICKQVLEHVHTPHAFIGAINHLLHPSGVLVLEIPDFELIAQKGDFSSVWEQHVGYFTLASITRLLDMNDLYIQRHHKIEFGGGSLLLFIDKKKKGMDGLADNRQVVDDFAVNIRNNLLRFQDLTTSLKDEGSSLCFFGAGARGVSMLNLSGRGDDFDFVVDDNPGKQGLYIPGCGLAVVSSEKLFSSKTSHCFLSPLNSKAAEAKILSRFANRGINMIEFFPGPFQNPDEFFRSHSSC